jgi:hypothetical protein
MKVKIRFLQLLALILFTVLLVGCSSGPPAGDYGDAPDGEATNYRAAYAQTGSFPTLLESNGARTLNVEEAFLGDTASAEQDANDEDDPDGVPNLTNTDSDDGLVDFFITLISIPPPTTLSVDVTAPEGSQGGTFYLNTVIDLNLDGEWGGQGALGEQEWVVQNEPVDVTPGETTPFTSPAFGFSNGLVLPDGAYMRVALTKEMVPDNWDGTGEFSAGEIEDHVIELPKKDGERLPVLTVDCNGPYKPGALVTCIVTNSGGAGTFTYNLHHIGTGTVNVPLPNCKTPGGEPPGGPVAIGDGPPPGAGPAPNPVMITCQSTAGKAPDRWKLTVKAIDPPSSLVPGGIISGMDDQSEAVFDFLGLAKIIQAYANVMGGNWIHYFGSSHIWWWAYIVYDDPIPVANATVTVTTTGESGFSQTDTITTGPDGIAANWLTIYQYDTYTVTIDNIEGENITYDPSMNTVDPLVLVVGPEDGVLPEVTPAMLEAFVEGVATAVRDKNSMFLLEHLDPAVLTRYGPGACQTYLEGLEDPTFSIRMLGFSGPEPWDFVRDDLSTSIPRAYSINANVTSQGETSSIDDFGLLYWFSDCGTSIP